jgi:ribosomal RNA-processing protein 12
MSFTELEQALAKIRIHTTSSLAHQKTPATLLHALETTFAEQATERSPTAYYAALLTTLDGTLQKERRAGALSLEDGDMLPAELYLLALTAPFVPHPVVRANLATVLNLTAPLFPAIHPHAPALRSQLGLYAAVLQALDRPHLETPGIRQAYASILQLCLDARPKVRRKAVEVVRDVLTQPPSPLLCHPYAERTAEWIQAALDTAAANPIAKGKGKKADAGGAEDALHVLAFLRVVLLKLPPAVSTPCIWQPHFLH